MNSNDHLLITGGTGFVGGHLVETLLEQGFKNIHVTTYDSSPEFINKLLDKNNIHKIDLLDKHKTNELINTLKPEIIFHLAGWANVGSSFDDGLKLITNTAKLQQNLLEAVINFCPKTRILSVGTALQYKFLESPLKETDSFGPENPYAVAKILQEMIGYSLVKSHKLDIVFTRSFNHIGERQAPGFVLADFCKQIVNLEQKGPGNIRVGNLEAIRDFTDVKDIAKAYILLMQKGVMGEVYNVGFGSGHSIQELLNNLISQSSSEIKILIDKDKFRPVDVKSVIADNTKIKQLGWEPSISLKQTLERTLNWWRKNL